jgi:folylpolyglutamate synthase/dihydropteroate synthase
MLRILAPIFRNIVLTAYDSPRAAETSELAKFLAREFPNTKAAEAIDPAHALTLAGAFTPPDGLILATGSIYLAGEILAQCRREGARKG